MKKDCSASIGGRFVAETLMPLILELQAAYDEAKKPIPPSRPSSMSLRRRTMSAGRARSISPKALTEHARQGAGGAGAKIYFKREELNHTGSHKVNNVLGQILLARRMGKTRIIAETGAGQHGVATATACARFGLKCIVYMGAVDIERQKPNVFRMKLLGAEVVPALSGSRTLKDAHQRGAARLGRQCRGYVLLHRHGGRPASLSGNGARLPMHHRQRDEEADAPA
jgi:tryptophan synthase beta chain